MKKKEKLQKIHDQLFAVYGTCTCPLKHDSPFQLLAAVMLSAQCKDERVNIVTKTLFAVAPDALAMSKLPTEEIEKITYEIANTKKSLIQIANEHNMHKSDVIALKNGKWKMYLLPGYTYPLRSNN